MPAMLLAAAYVLIAMLAYQGAAALAKLLGGALPAAEVGLFRAAGGILLIGLAVREMMRLRRLPDPGWHAVRGILGGAALIGIMYAIPVLPLALVAVMLHSRVLLIVPLAVLIRGERADGGLWAAALVGLAGVLISVAPSLREPESVLAVLLMAAATVASAVSQVAVAKLTDTNPPSLIVGVFGVASLLSIAPFAAVAWAPPDGPQLAILLGIAAAGALAQVCAAYAYRLAGAARTSPLGYCEVPLAAGLGFLVASEVPESHQIVGAIFVVGAAAYITFATERVKSQPSRFASQSA